MEEYGSPLKEIFENMSRRLELSQRKSGNIRTVQGQLFSLELGLKSSLTRLLYVDKVASADFYDLGDSKELTYTILTPYAQGQKSFLQGQDFNIARSLLTRIQDNGSTKVHRTNLRIKLEYFNEVEEFLMNHINHY